MEILAMEDMVELEVHHIKDRVLAAADGMAAAVELIEMLAAAVVQDLF